MSKLAKKKTDDTKIAGPELSFKDPAMQALFHLLCERWLCGTFEVRFLSRVEWEKGKKNIPEGKTLLSFPENATSEEVAEILRLAGRMENERPPVGIGDVPAHALAHFLFRRAMKYLARNMPFSALPRYAKNCLLAWHDGQITLYEALRVPVLRIELEEVRKTGDIRRISEKEFEIADKVQMVVRNFIHEDGVQQPADMIKKQTLNCRGGSFLGGAILSEIGVPYLLGDVPRHSILVITASDGTIEWHDMITPWANEELTRDKISGCTIGEIYAYIKDPTPDGLMFDVARFDNPRVEVKGRRFLTLFPPETGIQMQIIHGLAYDLVGCGLGEGDPQKKRDYFSQALLACELSAAYSPKYEYAYNKKGEVLCFLDRYAEAAEAFLLAQSANSQNSFCYFGLGNAYFALGKNKESTDAYRQYLALADKNTEDDFIKTANERLIQLAGLPASV